MTGLGVGMIALVAFFTAVGILAGTVLTSQVGVVGIGFGILILLPMIAALLPAELAALLPTSMVTWAAGLAAGLASSAANEVNAAKSNKIKAATFFM